MSDTIYCIKIVDSSDNFQIGSELLSALDFDFASKEDRESGQFFHTVYFETPEARNAGLGVIGRLVPQWESMGVKFGSVEPFDLAREDWAEAWKKFFPVLEISPTLAIRPSWLEYAPKPGQDVVTIDPGMSFGTGQHATTSFCLRVIDRLSGDGGVETMLDAGCGSGILAAAAAVKGFRVVDAFDYDPDAVRVAAENLALNRIDTVKPVIGDAADFQGAIRYDLVCANILGHLLKAYRHNIASWAGRYLALAGILSGDFDSVAAVFEPLGFKLIERCTEKEWTSGLFERV